MPRPKAVISPSAITVPEIAKQWHVHENTIYREIWRKRLRAFKVAGVWRVKPEDLARYLDERAS